MKTPCCIKYEELYQRLDNALSLDGNGGVLRMFLLEQLAEYEQKLSKGEKIAYGIARLLGADPLCGLPRMTLTENSFSWPVIWSCLRLIATVALPGSASRRWSAPCPQPNKHEN